MNKTAAAEKTRKAREAFHAFHRKHAASLFADPVVDLENARDSGFVEESPEFWQIALASAIDSFEFRKAEAAERN